MFLYRLKDDDYTLIRIDEDGANPEDCIEIYEGDFTELLEDPMYGEFSTGYELLTMKELTFTDHTLGHYIWLVDDIFYVSEIMPDVSAVVYKVHELRGMLSFVSKDIVSSSPLAFRINSDNTYLTCEAFLSYLDVQCDGEIGYLSKDYIEHLDRPSMYIRDFHYHKVDGVSMRRDH